jgi:hypothetical protein
LFYSVHRSNDLRIFLTPNAAFRGCFHASGSFTPPGGRATFRIAASCNDGVTEAQVAAAHAPSGGTNCASMKPPPFRLGLVRRAAARIVSLLRWRIHRIDWQATHADSELHL